MGGGGSGDGDGDGDGRGDGDGDGDGDCDGGGDGGGDGDCDGDGDGGGDGDGDGDAVAAGSARTFVWADSMFLKRWIEERGHERISHTSKPRDAHNPAPASAPPPPPPAAAATVLYDLISQGRVELVGGGLVQVRDQMRFTPKSGSNAPHTPPFTLPERRIPRVARRPARQHYARPAAPPPRPVPVRRALRSLYFCNNMCAGTVLSWLGRLTRLVTRLRHLGC